MRLRLRRIFFDMDLRRAAETNWAECKRRREIPANMKSGDCVLFLNKAKTMMHWAFPPVEFDAVNHVDREVHVQVVRSERVKIKGSTFSPEMLANYASDAGIELIGIRRFEQIWEEERAAA